MIEDAVKVIMKKVIAADYPHLKFPVVAFAKIVSVKKCGTYDVNNLAVTDEGTGRYFLAHITANTYEYKLEVVDCFGTVDSDFPALPGIISKKPFQMGDMVAIAFAYGNIDPVIIGEVNL